MTENVMTGLIPSIKVTNVKLTTSGTTLNIGLELEGISEVQLQQTMTLINLVLALTKK